MRTASLSQSLSSRRSVTSSFSLKAREKPRESSLPTWPCGRSRGTQSDDGDRTRRAAAAAAPPRRHAHRLAGVEQLVCVLQRPRRRQVSCTHAGRGGRGARQRRVAGNGALCGSPTRCSVQRAAPSQMGGRLSPEPKQLRTPPILGGRSLALTPRQRHGFAHGARCGARPPESGGGKRAARFGRAELAARAAAACSPAGLVRGSDAARLRASQGRHPMKSEGVMVSTMRTGHQAATKTSFFAVHVFST